MLESLRVNAQIFYRFHRDTQRGQSTDGITSLVIVARPRHVERRKCQVQRRMQTFFITRLEVLKNWGEGRGEREKGERKQTMYKVCSTGQISFSLSLFSARDTYQNSTMRQQQNLRNSEREFGESSSLKAV